MTLGIKGNVAAKLFRALQKFKKVPGIYSDGNHLKHFVEYAGFLLK